jgi:hypothetical protein
MKEIQKRRETNYKNKDGVVTKNDQHFIQTTDDLTKMRLSLKQEKGTVTN